MAVLVDIDLWILDTQSGGILRLGTMSVVLDVMHILFNYSRSDSVKNKQTNKKTDR